MDWFSCVLTILTLGGSSVLHTVFLARITGKRWKAKDLLAYFLLLCLIQKISMILNFPDIVSIGMETAGLYAMSRIVFGNDRPVSGVASILIVYITQLSFGVMNSVELVVITPDLLGPLLYLILILATLGAFALCVFCYTFVLRFLFLGEEGFRPYIWILLLSGLFFCAAELYIMQTAYSVVTFPIEAGKHMMLLFLQILGLCALLCTLYAYGRVCEDVKAQAALAAVSQAAKAQKSYIAEAQMRYERTQSFRHDIKNHLSVLNGLLGTGRVKEAEDYLKKMEVRNAALSFPYQTGNPVVDVLLGEKMELAKARGIETEVSLILPKACGIDAYDLCVIFANALDNAIEGCLSAADTKKAISVRGERQGDFYMLEFNNTCDSKPAAVMGTGLSNIRSVSEKYHGAMSFEKREGQFRLNVLLNISIQLNDISEQSY